jgi:hypothetical protein
MASEKKRLLSREKTASKMHQRSIYKLAREYTPGSYKGLNVPVSYSFNKI